MSASPQVIRRLAARFGSWPSRRGFAALVFCAAVAAQTLAYETWLQPTPTTASGYAASTALGLLNGRGLSVRPEEADAFRVSGRHADALPLYDPAALRGPAHEPLPGTSLLFAGVALATGALRQSTLVYLQIALHGLGAVLLMRELRARSGFAALAAGLGWALFAPHYRSTLVPGYDSLTSLVYVCALVALLHFLRSGRLASCLLGGVACGAGLWIRDYLFVLPLLLLPALWISPRRSFAASGLFALPVIAFAAGLAVARAPESGATNRFVRGGVWHSFWAGVGQFPNDVGVTDEDETVKAFAQRLAPGEDFDVPNYQYLPAYGEALRSAAQVHLREEWPSLSRNAAVRAGWLIFPSFGPSRKLASGAVRWAFVAVGVPVSLAALFGLFLSARRDPAETLVLASPLLGLLPLVPYYFIIKVVVAVFFVHLAFAGMALDSALRGGGRVG